MRWQRFRARRDSSPHRGIRRKWSGYPVVRMSPMCVPPPGSQGVGPCGELQGCPHDRGGLGCETPAPVEAWPLTMRVTRDAHGSCRGGPPRSLRPSLNASYGKVADSGVAFILAADARESLRVGERTAMPRRDAAGSIRRIHPFREHGEHGGRQRGFPRASSSVFSVSSMASVMEQSDCLVCVAATAGFARSARFGKCERLPGSRRPKKRAWASSRSPAKTAARRRWVSSHGLTRVIFRQMTPPRLAVVVLAQVAPRCASLTCSTVKDGRGDDERACYLGPYAEPK